MAVYGGSTPTPKETLRAQPGETRVSGVSPADTLTPADRYQELFVEVQIQCVFPDSKTFVDCIPLLEPEHILQAYRARRSLPGFDLVAFVHEHFAVEEVPANCFVSDPNRTLAEHIDHLWAVLTRHPKEHPIRSSLLPLPNDYVVPGGRFSELYYWDSYFTMLGFTTRSCRHLLRTMADNFAFLIDTYGHIPNGNRTYYLSRSQPPVFCLMVALFAQEGVKPAVEYLPQLRKEYAFWMDGSQWLHPGEAHRRCVRLQDGELLNRYWDDRDTPREESYREDIATASRSDRPAYEVFRDLRAGAESGWDFSSRWLAVDNDLSTIRTTAILPVDLNCFIYKLEDTISTLSETIGDRVTAQEFREKARLRRVAMDKYLWNEAEGAFFDFDWQLCARRLNLTAATVVPLFVESASARQAQQVELSLRNRMLAPGGVSTTEIGGTDQQWDRPNGWAPLQWMAIRGLCNYCHLELASEIRKRWLNIVAELYRKEGKLVEKYVLRPTTEHAKGGEYPLQDGFGWTNGVTARLLQEDPMHEANRCRALR